MYVVAHVLVGNIYGSIIMEIICSPLQARHKVFFLSGCALYAFMMVFTEEGLLAYSIFNRNANFHLYQHSFDAFNQVFHV